MTSPSEVNDEARPVDPRTFDLEELLRGEVADWVARCLLRDMTRELRSNGKRPPDYAQLLLEALGEASRQLIRIPVSASGRPVERVVTTSWVPVHEAAARVGRSERRVRQLAAAGGVRARKFGREWQIDLESLTNVLRRAA